MIYWGFILQYLTHDRKSTPAPLVTLRFGADKYLKFQRLLE